MSEDWLSCFRCGKPYDVSVGQSAKRGILRWSASCVCPGCDQQQELDGIGLPPPELRSRILAQDGVQVLTVEPGTHPRVALRQLQKVLCLSDEAVASLTPRIPGAVLAGTPYEMEWLVGVLRARGILTSSAAEGSSGESGAVDLAEVVPEDWADQWTPSSD